MLTKNKYFEIKNYCLKNDKEYVSNKCIFRELHFDK